MLDTNEWNIDIPARLNDVVDESLNEITKMHRRKVGKRIGTVCGSVFAFVGAFFIFGFANPALASEIPLLGNLFRQVNTDGKVYGPANIDSYGLVREVGKTAETDNPDCSLTVVNAYSDGSTIQIGLELAFSGDLADLADRYAWIDTQYGGASTVTVNGEEPPLVQMNGFFYRAEKWVSTVNLNVPDSQKNAETFRVSMALQGFSGLVKESIAGNQTTREPLDSAFTVEFPVEADRDNGFSFRCEAEDNGAKVLGVSGTPARTVISVEKPYWGEAVPGAVDLTAPDCYPKGVPYL